MQIRKPLRLVGFPLLGAAGLLGISLLLEQMGFRGPFGGPRHIRDWLLTAGVRIVFIVAGATLVVRAARLGIESLEEARVQGGPEVQRRASTLARVLTKGVTSAVTFVAALMVATQLHLDVVSIITGAGIAGLAVGFGAQNVVRDVIAGFFLLFEDQVRIGDVARINDTTGTVEYINLRTMLLRDEWGAVHVFPNGTITELANLSKDFAYAVVDVRVRCSEDIDRVLQTMKDVGDSLQRDPAWAMKVIESLEILGVDSFDQVFAVVRARFKTVPLEHRSVASELRRRIMVAFAAKKIRPFG